MIRVKNANDYLATKQIITIPFTTKGIYDYCYDCRLFKCFGKKTIQRDLRLLEQWLEQWRITVEKRAGAGVMLDSKNITDLLHLDHLLGAECEEIDGVMNNARRVKIASQLLSETPNETSISKLSERYFISGASIVNDLRVIESRLRRWGYH
ncbi:hypothetical protein BANRA_00060 [Escherichia coli]|nr:hypothetical protein BANRA_00060 [Escherichia coli]